MGSTAPQDIGYLSSATALKVSACGGMERLPDIRTRAEGKTFVSEIFKCRGKPYRIGFTRVHGRMTDTIVTIVAPPNDWPSHDLSDALRFDQTLKPRTRRARLTNTHKPCPAVKRAKAG